MTAAERRQLQEWRYGRAQLVVLQREVPQLREGTEALRYGASELLKHQVREAGAG